MITVIFENIKAYGDVILLLVKLSVETAYILPAVSPSP